MLSSLSGDGDRGCRSSRAGSDRCRRDRSPGSRRGGVCSRPTCPMMCTVPILSPTTRPLRRSKCAAGRRVDDEELRRTHSGSARRWRRRRCTRKRRRRCRRCRASCRRRRPRATAAGAPKSTPGPWAPTCRCTRRRAQRQHNEQRCDDTDESLESSGEVFGQRAIRLRPPGRRASAARRADPPRTRRPTPRVRGTDISNTNPRGKLFPHVCGHALGRRVARLDHRQQDALEREAGILGERRANAAQNLRRRLERQRLALERNQHVLAAREHAVHDRRPARAACRRSRCSRAAARARTARPCAATRRTGADSARATRSRSRCRPTRREARAGSSFARPCASRACRRDSRRARCAVGRGLSPSPKRTEPCGSASIKQRLASAASERGREVDRGRRLAHAAFLADDREDLSHAIARTRRGPSSPLRSVCRAFPRRAGPSAPLPARWRLGQERLEMLFRARPVAALEQQEREPVVRARQVRRDLERVPIVPDRLFRTIRLRERDRHVLEDLRVVRPVAQREACTTSARRRNRPAAPTPSPRSDSRGVEASGRRQTSRRSGDSTRTCDSEGCVGRRSSLLEASRRNRRGLRQSYPRQRSASNRHFSLCTRRRVDRSNRASTPLPGRVRLRPCHHAARRSSIRRVFSRSSGRCSASSRAASRSRSPAPTTPRSSSVSPRRVSCPAP